jgi:hypothetical protein
MRILNGELVDSYTMSAQGRGPVRVYLKDGTKKFVQRSNKCKFVILNGKRHIVVPNSITSKKRIQL